jgi:O-antigen/teichoic acid export membrane protein
MPALALSVTLANVILFLYLVIPYLFRTFFTKYQDGIEAAQWLMVGSFFGYLLRNAANYLVATSKISRLFLHIGIGLALFLCLVFLTTDLGLKGIAVAFGVSGFFTSAAAWRAVLTELGYSLLDSWLIIIQVFLPCLAMVTTLAVATFIYPQWTRFGLTGFALLGLSIFLAMHLALCLSPLFRQAAPIWLNVLQSQLSKVTRRLLAGNEAQVVDTKVANANNVEK